MGRVPFQIFTGINRRLYNPEIAKGDFSDIKGDLSVAKVYKYQVKLRKYKRILLFI